ncbi:MAG: hypothetical protein ACTSPQ_07435 [Candidatus Helarchaeota archaeon]
MYNQKRFESGLERAEKFLRRAVKRNNYEIFEDTFQEIIDMCIQLNNLERALEIKRAICSQLRS